MLGFTGQGVSGNKSSCKIEVSQYCQVSQQFAVGAQHQGQLL